MGPRGFHKKMHQQNPRRLSPHSCQKIIGLPLQVGSYAMLLVTRVLLLPLSALQSTRVDYGGLVHKTWSVLASLSHSGSANSYTGVSGQIPIAHYGFRRRRSARSCSASSAIEASAISALDPAARVSAAPASCPATLQVAAERSPPI